jgi:hypothetical protein
MGSAQLGRPPLPQDGLTVEGWRQCEPRAAGGAAVAGLGVDAATIAGAGAGAAAPLRARPLPFCDETGTLADASGAAGLGVVGASFDAVAREQPAGFALATGVTGVETIGGGAAVGSGEGTAVVSKTPMSCEMS